MVSQPLFFKTAFGFPDSGNRSGTANTRLNHVRMVTIAMLRFAAETFLEVLKSLVGSCFSFQLEFEGKDWLFAMNTT